MQEKESKPTVEPPANPDVEAGARGSAEPPVSAVRRRLVKGGAFIPPVMLTLRSKSAAASSLAICQPAGQELAERRAIANPEGFELRDRPDEFLRTRIRIREARRVRKVNGKWFFKGPRSFPVYTRTNAAGREWLSLRPSNQGRRGRFVPSGRRITVRDALGNPIASGDLYYLNGNRRKRFITITEEDQERYALVQAAADGTLVYSEEEPGYLDVGNATNPAGGLQASVMTASCWASISPVREI
jgi:hypothetical protein